jgi:nucleotide sugar dehydrogenase
VNVAVIGLGKIGLPLAVQAATRGHRVRGADISKRVVELVNAGEPPFPGERDLPELLRGVVDEGLLTATRDTRAAVAEADTVVVVVPLMTDESGIPDFSAMDSATVEIAAALQPGTLVSYETTLPVGTTRNRFAPMLEEGSGLVVGERLFLVHSPERVFSGRVFSDLKRYPKLVGGVDAGSTERGRRFYEDVLEFEDRPDLDRPNGVWTMASAEAAEMAKLAETTYRDVNIALANEFAAFAEEAGIDVSEVIASANSQPFSHIHRPGVAVGGHCIPVYPRFYLSGHPAAELVETARRVNLAVPARAIAAIADTLGGLVGRKVLILGAAYRGGVKETAYSGVFDLARAIAANGGTAIASDPLYDDEELRRLGLEPWDGSAVDAAVVQSDHREYLDLSPEDVPGVEVLFDGRGVVDVARWKESGVVVRVIGQGSTID